MRSEECVSTRRLGAMVFRVTAPVLSPGAVFVQDTLKRAHQLLRVDGFLAPEAVHFLIEVSKLHPGLGEVAQLLR